MFYDAGSRTVQSVRRVGQAAAEIAATPSPASEISALERQLVFQSSLVDQLRRENAVLRGLRESHVAPNVRLIPARVVARDIVAVRDSALVSGGATRGMKWNDWVVSRIFVDAGGHEGVERGFSVLAREVLIGRIEFVQPYMARVALLTDVQSRTAVRVGRLNNGRFVAVDYPATLHGRGRGRMEIEDVPQRYVMSQDSTETPADDARMRSGDLVVSEPDTSGLVAPMVVGRVAAISVDPRKRLVCSVQIEPALKADELRDVYIVAGLPGRDDLLGTAEP